MPTTRISDIVVPQFFAAQSLVETRENSSLIKSGAVRIDDELSTYLKGPGVIFNKSFLKDLENDVDNISSDDPSTLAAPRKIQEGVEQQVRLSRNQGWSVMDLSDQLSAADPLRAISQRAGEYWSRRLQAAFIATMQGVFADNAAAPTGQEHVQNDMTHDIKGAGYNAGVTSISAAATVDARGTLGDRQGDAKLIMMHSIVYNRLAKNNAIDFIPESINDAIVNIPMYLGMRVIVSDSMVSPERGVYETWIFGEGAVRIGMASGKNDGATERNERAGNGAGEETLWSRKEFIVHPVGMRYAGTVGIGGPSNAATSNNLAHADSWQRVYPERKQIKIARLITREF